MSDKSKEQEDTQKNPQIGTLRSDDDFDLFAETHSAPSSQHVFDEAYHQQDSLFLSGMHQDGETSGVTMSNSFLQTASSSSLFTEEQLNPGNLVPTVSSDMQFYASQAPMSSYSNSCMLKKLILDMNIREPVYPCELGEYCPINVGDVLNSEFVIIRKLGQGAYSSVWMAWNTVLRKYVALKISQSESVGIAEQELNFQETCTNTSPNAMGADNVVRLLSSFTHISGFRTYIVMALEVCGPSLNSVLFHSNQKVIHLEQVRRICRQLLEAVSFLHDECGIIHSDIKPANIMIAVSNEDVQRMDPNRPENDSTTSSFDLDFTHPDSDIRIKLGDLGLSCWVNNPFFGVFQTCEYRAPEVFLKSFARTTADMWSVGCVAFELVTGTDLFYCGNTGSEVEEATHHLRQMSLLIGNLPYAPYCNEQNVEFLEHFFESNGRFVSDTSFDPSRLLNRIRGHRNIALEDAKQCAHFISSCLTLDPTKRPTAKQALTHQFLLPYGGKSEGSFAREIASDVNSHARHEGNDSNFHSLTPNPNQPSSSTQYPERK
ncbi:hypothetical protein CAEBREN_12400 [Caenorhabditis brenneri]|uniref:non-specific serine/threonine protein kinase n=1 Tax=Caenorhabditis brenneri TaxID=135651 RepID=G0MH88_CAEBE|nr:hypothetical protein CAEBREN_12400 [Caenorhabditis brenneri]